MITISKILLNNIKRFKGSHEFKFSDKNVFTISGKNGSGKTTIIESLMICQMAYFVHKNKELIENTEFMVKANNKICSLLSGQKSSISLFMYDSESQKDISFTVNISYIAKNISTWKFDITSESDNIFSKYWDLHKPSCLFFFIDSDKYFEEKSITYDSIKIKKNDDPDSFLLNYIIDYKNVEKFAYQKLINDWILQRLVPPDTNYQMSFLIGRILFSYLIPQLRIQHFTGATGDEFSILAKNIKEKSKEFDYRYLSAGEKSIFYLCILINYFSNIGLLIIDEPENHLHEDLLLRLVDLLQKITTCKNYPNFIMEKNVLTRKIKNENTKFEQDLNKIYKNYKLQKVIFTTHSKSLIYKNFEFGENYLLNSDFELLTQTSAEEELRKLGISTIYEKILFVEGQNDKEVADKVLSNTDITVIPLSGCEHVIQMYKDLQKIKSILFNMKICFLMDRDTKDEQIDELEKIDSDFFTNHFIVLERHELENYYLDEKLWEDLIMMDASSGIDMQIKKEDIPILILNYANETKINVYQKELNEKLRMQINSLSKMLGKSSKIKCDTDESFEKYTNQIIANIDLEILKNNFLEIYKKTKEKYANWANDYLKFCDGKIVFGKFITELAKQLKVTPERIRIYLDKLIQEDKDCKYEVSKVFRKVREILE